MLTRNQLRAFNKELKPQTGKKYNYQQMWAIVTTLGQFLNRDASMSWMMVDDSTRCERLNALIGCSILTALNELDRIGQFKADSKFIDLAQVSKVVGGRHDISSESYQTRAYQGTELEDRHWWDSLLQSEIYANRSTYYF